MPGLLSEPSKSKQAHQLDPDLHPWERQPAEAIESYQRFIKFRDSTDRKLSTLFDDDPISMAGVYQLSYKWQWGYRAACFDRWEGQREAEEMVRYRRDMGRRQRTTARLAQQKIANWLLSLNPETLKPVEAAKWYEVAVRVEQLASGAALDGTYTPPAPEDSPGKSLAQLIGVDPSIEEELVKVIAEMLPNGS